MLFGGFDSSDFRSASINVDPGSLWWFWHVSTFKRNSFNTKQSTLEQHLVYLQFLHGWRWNKLNKHNKYLGYLNESTKNIKHEDISHIMMLVRECWCPGVISMGNPFCSFPLNCSGRCRHEQSETLSGWVCPFSFSRAHRNCTAGPPLSYQQRHGSLLQRHRTLPAGLFHCPILYLQPCDLPIHHNLRLQMGDNDQAHNATVGRQLIGRSHDTPASSRVQADLRAHGIGNCHRQERAILAWVAIKSQIDFQK